MVALLTATFFYFIICASCEWVCQNTTWTQSSTQFIFPRNTNFVVPRDFNCSYTIIVSNGSVAELELLSRMALGDTMTITFGSDRQSLPADETYKLPIFPPSAVVTVISTANFSNSFIKATVNWRTFNGEVSKKNFASTDVGSLFNVSESRDTTWVLSAENKIAIHPFPALQMHLLLSTLLYDGNGSVTPSELKLVGTMYHVYMNRKTFVSVGNVVTIRSVSPMSNMFFFAQDSSALTGVSEVQTFQKPWQYTETLDIEINGLSNSAVAIVLNEYTPEPYFLESYSIESNMDNNGMIRVYPIFPSSQLNLDSLSLTTYINTSSDEGPPFQLLPQAFAGQLRFFQIKDGLARITLTGDKSRDMWDNMVRNRVGVLDIEGLAEGETRQWAFRSAVERRLIFNVRCEFDKEIDVNLLHDGKTTKIENLETTEKHVKNFAITARMKNISALGCTVMFSVYDDVDGGHSPVSPTLSLIFAAMIYIFNRYNVS